MFISVKLKGSVSFPKNLFWYPCVPRNWSMRAFSGVEITYSIVFLKLIFQISYCKVAFLPPRKYIINTYVM